ncbi:unnamed protein product, partial [Sphacelaria rigidula]
MVQLGLLLLEHDNRMRQAPQTARVVAHHVISYRRSTVGRENARSAQDCCYNVWKQLSKWKLLNTSGFLFCALRLWNFREESRGYMTHVRAPTLRVKERQLAPTALDQCHVPVPEKESRKRSVFEVARSLTRLGLEHLRDRLKGSRCGRIIAGSNHQIHNFSGLIARKRERRIGRWSKRSPRNFCASPRAWAAPTWLATLKTMPGDCFVQYKLIILQGSNFDTNQKFVSPLKILIVRVSDVMFAQVDDGLDVSPFYQRPNGGRGHAIKYPLYHFLLHAPRNTEADVRPPQKMNG